MAVSVWMYDPVFALAIIGIIAYFILFVWISYLTLIKYRAWFFIVVVVGTLMEVVAYILRAYSIKNQSEIVNVLPTLSQTSTNSTSPPL